MPDELIALTVRALDLDLDHNSPTMAAVDVYSLLSFPASQAFSALRRAPDAGVEHDSRSDSPPRKVPRLADDSDSASASRARAPAPAAAERAGEKSAVVVLKLKGASRA